MPDPRPSRHATELPSRGRRAVVCGVALAGVVHSVLVALWVMPSNPIRDAVGPGRVAAYIENGVVPFEQSWSVFAPTPRRGGESVQVRSYDTETGATTDWFDVTADENARVRHLPSPSRFHAATRRLGGRVNEELPDLSTEQVDLLSSDTPSGRQLMRRLPRDVVDLDEMLTRFGSLYAVARWGEGVSMVQVKVGHRRVPPFADRHRRDYVDVPFSYRTFGWRIAFDGDTAAQRAFDDYVARAPVRSGG